MVHRQGRHAFTLIELLVVIAIIAILAAILFPVFAQAKGAAKKTQGLNNVKQIGIASQMYAGDNDDMLPAWNEYFGQGAYASETGNGGYTGFQCDGLTGEMRGCWHAKLAPFVKNGKVDAENLNATNNDGLWHAPEAGSQGEMVYFPNSQRYAFSYGFSGVSNYNGYIQTARTDKFYRYPSFGEMDQVANTIYVGDGGGYNGRLGSPTTYDCYKKRLLPTTAYSSGTFRELCWEIPDRYLKNSATYSFMDGHAKVLRDTAAYPKPANPNAPTAGETKSTYAAVAKFWAYDSADRSLAESLSQ